MRTATVTTCLLIATALLAQIPPGLPSKDNPFILRKVGEKSPCAFAGEYDQIRAKKTDPRVAYIEPNALVSGDQPDFTQSCKAITQQTEDSVTLFDKADGYLAIFFGMPQVSATVTYFAGQRDSVGIFVYMNRTDEASWTCHVFRYIGGKWLDQSNIYLTPLHLAKNDFFLAPQYGRTGRILTQTKGDFAHREWVAWDGKSFVITASAPHWRCPSATRYLDKDEREQFCSVNNASTIQR